MPRIKLTADAKADLINIRRYGTQRWGSKQSQKYIKSLRKTIDLLAKTPSIGRRFDIGDFNADGLDAWHFSRLRHEVCYSQSSNEIIVFAVLHQSQIPLKHLSGRSLEA
ncbi:MAG: plasmid stabilization protein [Alteromonadaceae bacterium]|nr:MAG: plasmid stabilization protein [Alteromonadaceae bacterium]